MELDIRRLTPELLDDYLNFFDNTAFADHPDWSQCYCIHFHWRSEWDNELMRGNRDGAIEHIKNGTIQGYLAYLDGKVVGWCNTNDKYIYSGLVWRKETCEGGETKKKIKSVVCFLVASDMRGRGMAIRLLERICVDAVDDGYDYIEAYPPMRECDEYAAHHGTMPFFEKHGFQIYKMAEHDVMMRKYLRDA